jgi:2-(1,2-epoxy-1,2-dihydrophenyl)acetyl-CoA isomerase
MDFIKLEKQDSVATITFNRPEVFNSFNQKMAFALHAALDDCQSDDSVRAVVMRGTGKAFCAGQDLQEVTDPKGPMLTSIVRDHYNPIVERIRHLDKPVIAAVNGVAAGAGANIALCCDVVLACESSSFIQAFSKIGLIPDSGGTFTLPRLIGFQRASALMMLGEKVSAKDAESIGMIYKSVKDDDFNETVNEIASKLASMPTKGLAYTKKALNRSMQNDLTSQLALEEQLQTKASTTEDYKEGVQAFLEKRKPHFKGK